LEYALIGQYRNIQKDPILYTMPKTVFD